VERWDRIGRYAAYGAALALTPYLVIKVTWVIGSILGLAPIGQGFNRTGWIVLNTATVGMAGVGISLALALVRPWGMRIPDRLVAFCAWTGAGFLVAILPFAVLSTLLDSAGNDPAPAGDGSAEASMPGWEAALVQFSFIGMGLGLALALPAHLRRRWPEMFAERTGGGGGTGVRAAARWAPVVAATVGLVWLYWAVGGTLGLAHPEERTTDGYLLNAVGGSWAIAAAVAVWLSTLARPSRVPRRVLLAVGLLGSGSLFAWSGWKLPFTLYVALADPADVTMPENLVLAASVHVAAVVAGVGLLRLLLSPLRHASAGVTESDTAGPRRNSRNTRFEFESCRREPPA